MKTTWHVKEKKEEIINGLEGEIKEFTNNCKPMESELHLIMDERTDAIYCECHISSEVLCALSTCNVPLDPDEQPDYRANREIVEDHVAFKKMKADALGGRSFSNIVCEYTKELDPDSPIKIIGGQHRYEAIKKAFLEGVNQYHGLKIYFGLDAEQRLDVQLISNTNIDVSKDLLDRMYETVSGPYLRKWCQKVGLLDEDEDFADKRARGNPVTVRDARIFITNYYKGKELSTKTFPQVNTTPVIAKSGIFDEDWESFKENNKDIWVDRKLEKAGKEFALLVKAQYDYFNDANTDKPTNYDYAYKALNTAVIAGWSFCAGVLANNAQRLKRHYGLKIALRTDPLNSAMLAKGRHKTDSDTYRGLGYRQDAKERGRMAELFFLQAEKGEGIKKPLVDAAIARYHAKEAVLEAAKMEAKI